ISVAGNVDESFVQSIEDNFGHFEGKKKDVITHHATYEPEKIYRNKDTEQAHFCLGYQGLPLCNEDIYSLVILNNVLGGSMSSRLFQEVREKKGLAYSVFSYHASFLDNG